MSPWVGTKLSLSIEDRRTDARRDDRTRLARPNSQARAGTGKKKTCFLFS